MGQPIAVRTDFTAVEVRRLAAGEGQRSGPAPSGDRAWNTLIAQPWKIMSIGLRDWDYIVRSDQFEDWY